MKPINVYVSKYLSKNGYRLFFVVNHELNRMTTIERSHQTRYNYYQGDNIEELKTFKDVIEKHKQFINRGYQVV